MTSIWSYFFDPLLQASTLGSMLMCLASSLVGVMVFLRKRSLLGETLSHACYPGVVFGIVIASFFFPEAEEVIAVAILVGAFIFSMMALVCLDFLEKRLSVKSDAALCFILATFFGLGVLLASRVQFTHMRLFKQMQVFLYGQAATMHMTHVMIYASLAALIAFFLYIFYRPLQMTTFDRDFSKSIGLSTKYMDTTIFVLLGIAIVVGIRSVGVVLMSGMLILPPVAARFLTNRLSSLFFMAGLIGMISGFFGNYLSIEIPAVLIEGHPDWKFSLPTGPMIILCAASICFFLFFFSTEKGLCRRFFRIISFRNRCLEENILKSFWKKGEGQNVPVKTISWLSSISFFHVKFSFWKMQMHGWLEKIDKNVYRLTQDGFIRAQKVVRLHRLWEVYLVDYLGQGAEKVHANAETMEHMITPELEKELIDLLGNPQKDPHHQPIPPKRGGL